MANGAPHNRHELSRLRQSGSLCPFLGPARQLGARRRRAVDRLHKHHRLLCSSRLSLRPRAGLQPSLRLQELGPSLSLSTPHDLHPPPRHHPHWRAVDQSRADYAFHGPRSRDYVHGRHLLSLFSPGSFHKHLDAATSRLPEIAGGDETSNVVHSNGGDVSYPVELRARGGGGAGRSWGGDRFCSHESAHDGADDGVRLCLRPVGMEMGRRWRRRWWDWGAAEAGGAELYGDLLGVVVV